MRAFKHVIGKRTDDVTDRLYFLEQYTSGQPRELVRSCQQITVDGGYDRAKVLLEQHFGDKQKIASAYLNNALSWPAIKPEDAKAFKLMVSFSEDVVTQ